VRATLGQLAWLFLRLGATAFGGPAAHVAMMEDEVVRRRGWLARDKFLDLLAAANLIPGPNSTELAIHIGFDQQRWLGLVVAGVCFIVPAMVIVMAIGWAYVTYGTLPEAQGVLYGIKPVILAVIAQALWNLARTAVKSWQLGLVGVWALAAITLGVHELVVLGAAGAFAAAFAAARKRVAVVVPLPLLFGFFAKVGAVLYGSGYVLIAFLHSDLVERWRWLTEDQLLDAIAVGQVTPGPVFTTATFVGYILDGPVGGLVATAGIFLPAFVFVAASGPLVPRIRRSRLASAVLDGVSVGSLALMAWAGVLIGRETLIDPIAVALCVIAAVVLIRYRPNATWLIAGGALVGIVRALLL
jgi:chromate transporter